MKPYVVNIIVGVAIAVVFAILWYSGNLARFRNYVLETREELRKCTWPTWEELRGSTVLVVICVLLLTAFTWVIDLVLVNVVRWMAAI
ncbi:MAG: SecE/Sec61-gamma subunit of protein translocation complex [Verrucomicrobiota bacterium]|jgi:preprotein translocase subunit SecE